MVASNVLKAAVRTLCDAYEAYQGDPDGVTVGIRCHDAEQSLYGLLGEEAYFRLQHALSAYNGPLTADAMYRRLCDPKTGLARF